MNEEAKKLVEDIRSVCTDRLGAKTADGKILGEAFDELLELLSKKQK